MTARHAVANAWDCEGPPSCRQLFGCAREAVLADFAGYAWGQLLALDAGHRIALEFPGVTRVLPAGQVRRGSRDARRWLSSHQRG